MNRKRNRKAFTIVELVIVIAVIAVLVTVLVPTFDDVIQNAKVSAAKQDAKNAYTSYMVENAAKGEMPELFLYKAEEGRVVAIQNGAAVGVYEGENAALSELIGEDYDASELKATADEKLFAYGGKLPSTPGKPEGPTFAPFIHISFDDVQNCFGNLKSKNYNSLFEEPFLGWLKDLHDNYGAKFSLYVYGNTLTSVPNTYAAEFASESDWLKIGLHAPNSSGKYSSATYEYGKTQWNEFVANVKRITGTMDSVDKFPRLHYFAGSEAALQGMRDGEYGATGFLTADGERASYYLSDEIVNYLYNHDHITDNNNDLTFLATDLRGDWFENINFNVPSDYKNIHKPTHTNVYDEFVYRYTEDGYAEAMTSVVFFAHEWKIYGGTSLNSYRVWIEDACKFAKEYDVPFDFPQNRSFSETEFDIPEAVEPPAPEKETTMFNSQTATIVDSIYDMEYVAGYSISGGSAKVIPNSIGRCVSLSFVLRVEGGEMLKLNTAQLNGNTLSYAVLEFKDKTLTNENINMKGHIWKSWITGEIHLQEDTKYIVLGFKKGDGSLDFTTDELEQLRSCLDIWKFNTVNVSEWYWFDSPTGFQIQIDLKQGDIVNFIHSSVWDTYKFAIRTYGSTQWIQGGNANWQNGAFTVKADGKYTIYVRDKNSVNGTITESDKPIIAQNTGYWRKIS